jgi:hypothetical protein
MKSQTLLLAGLFIGFLSASQFVAKASINPYLLPITGRNLFGLEKVRTDDPPCTESVPAVSLHGIVALPSGPHALLRVKGYGRTVESTVSVSLLLRDGTASGPGLRVLEINVSAGKVTVLNHGKVQTLRL